MSNVAQNTVTNMAEDATMMIGYSIVNSWITDQLKDYFPTEVDPDGKEKTNYALEILSGGASFLFMSAMMEVIEREEKFIQYLFAAGEAVIVVLYARNRGAFESIGRRISSMRGIRAINRLGLFNSHTDVTNSFVGQVYQQIQTIMQGRNTSREVAQTIGASNSSMDTAINREAHDHRFANANNKAFSDSLMIKMVTGTFTDADKAILQRVIGRNNFSTVPLDIKEMNKIREFMIIEDSNGKYVGLTEAFTSLINGLGFLKKQRGIKWL